MPTDLIHILATLIDVAAASGVTLHVLKTRTDVRASAGWIALAWLSPFLGSLLYAMLGINRIARRANRLRRTHQHRTPSSIVRSLPHFVGAGHLRPICTVGDRVTGRTIHSGNTIEPLRNGDEAYPLMLEAIASAQKDAVLCTYIFEDDSVGRAFIDALAKARARGVKIRVLIDGIGGGYVRCPTAARLRAENVEVARFLHTWLPWRMPFINMRLHKKLLVVDGMVGFTGGINIAAENLEGAQNRIQDMHFRVSGPVVEELTKSFEEDWLFATGHRRSIRTADLDCSGSTLARGIPSGPDEDILTLEAVVLAAVNAARHRIRIVTPYFLPDRSLAGALRLATLRGVDIEIVIPQQSNHPIIDWATRAQLAPLLTGDSSIYLGPRPFDHSKLMTVDSAWALIGSANWDVRSFRLNFEFCLEVWDPVVASKLDLIIDRKIRSASRLALKDLHAQSTVGKLRNAAARLLLPYL